jgi:geranylgeranyl reductase family protein
MIHDVVIVGAGPAGCAAAFDLCAKGRSVLLIDKKKFPRHKACGGALTIKAVKALRFSIAPVARQKCYDLVLGNGIRHRTTINNKHPIAVMTKRSEFDSYFLEQTIKAGTQFAVKDSITGLQETEELIILDTGTEHIKARFLLGADGANSIIRKLTGNADWSKKGFALEGSVARSDAHLPAMEFDFGVVNDGYGWIFPKGDHINIGVYTNNPSLKLNKDILVNYAHNRLQTQTVTNIYGGFCCFGGENYLPHSKKIFLIGDAAGFCDPFLCEGIYNAIKSGQAVAHAINNEINGTGQALEMYRKALSSIHMDLRACKNAAIKFYADIDSGYAKLTSPKVRFALMKGFAAGLTYHRIKKYSFLLPFYPVTNIGI